MKEMILQLFGSYAPVTYTTYIQQEVEGTLTTEAIEVVASGLAGVDWPWLIGAVAFLLVLYSLFRLLGVFFK